MITEDRACFNGVQTRRLSVSGNGIPIGLLHGFADSADTWRGLMAEFEAAGRAAFAVDMPGFGHADPRSPGSIVPQLDAFVDAMLIDTGGPVILMGNSLGACVSVGAAARRSGNVRGVVAMNEPILASHWLMRLARGRVDPFRPLEFRLPIPKGVHHRMVRGIFARALYADPAQADPAVLTRFTGQASDVPRLRQLLKNARVVALETATGYQPEHITCPVLVIHGAKDRVIPVHASERLHKSVPASSLVVMPNSGHCPQLDEPSGLAAAVAAKVTELRLFQSEWEGIGARGRKEWLLAFQDWIFSNADRIADVLQSETAKPRVDASIEPTFVADVIHYYAGNAEKFLADEHPSPHSPLAKLKRLTTIYRPYPVVGLITPWNFPFALPGIDLVPALLAGATVLLKPSEVTPLGALELQRGWTEIGAPPVFAVATGGGDTGAAVLHNVDYVQFTGSTRTGKAIAKECAERLIPYSLELGGKDPAIVLADADLDRAAYGIAYGGLLNAGQTCVSIERVYVEEPVYDDFVARLTTHVGALRQGQDDRRIRHDVGPMANTAQLELVQRHVNEAIAAGARTTTGGKPTGVGTFFEPTVLTDVNHSMSCITEETFGPTLPVMKVADEAEAIRMANDSEFGLSATVWAGDKARGERVARQLQVGAVNINDAAANLFSFALPMGGWKQSGLGTRWGGASGLRKYCRVQAITSPRTPTRKRELIWFPYSPLKVGFALSIMRAAAARGKHRLRIIDRRKK